MGKDFLRLLEKRWVEWLLLGEFFGCLLLWDVHKEEGGLGYVCGWCWNNVATGFFLLEFGWHLSVEEGGSEGVVEKREKKAVRTHLFKSSIEREGGPLACSEPSLDLLQHAPITLAAPPASRHCHQLQTQPRTHLRSVDCSRPAHR